MWKCQDCGNNPDNYKGKNEFICSRCTDARVNFVAMLEEKFAKEIRRFRIESQKGKKEKVELESLGIIRNSKEYDFALSLWKSNQAKKEDLEKYSSVDLARARKSKGLSLESLATFLGISKSYLCKMEKGQKPLSCNTIQFIKEGINFSEKSKKSLNTISRMGR